jgi:hypothetical protein
MPIITDMIEHMIVRFGDQDMSVCKAAIDGVVRIAGYSNLI